MLEKEKSKLRRLERERERAREYTAKLIIAFGAVVALAQIIKSPDPTPTQKSEAEERLRALNDQAKTNCIFRGGIFFEGGSYSVGTCSK